MGSVVDTVKDLFDDLDGLAARLAAGIGDEPFEQYPAENLAQLQRDRVIGAGLRGLDKIGAGRESAVDSQERAGLEAIVMLEGRPPLMVANGTFEQPPPEWAALEEERTAIDAVIPRVGRVDVDGHPRLDWVGTASLVGPGTLMTNRHVAVEFSEVAGDGWAFRPGMTSRLDVCAESGAPAPQPYRITGVIGVHESHDLALLTVAGTSDDGAALPDPLTVVATEPSDLTGTPVYVVGHPAWDGRRNDPEAMARLFFDVYNVKRLQPGEVMPEECDAATLAHDCSTLGGNSGSPVLSLSSHRVVGLHFGGRYGVGNYAVPLWTLVDDPLLRAGGVNFG